MTMEDISTTHSGNVDNDTELVNVNANVKTTKKVSSLRIREFIEKTPEPFAVPRPQRLPKLDTCCVVS